MSSGNLLGVMNLFDFGGRLDVEVFAKCWMSISHLPIRNGSGFVANNNRGRIHPLQHKKCTSLFGNVENIKEVRTFGITLPDVASHPLDSQYTKGPMHQ